MANIIPTLERKRGVIQAQPERHSGLRAVAENLDRRLAAQATIELVTEALCRLAALLYERDRAGWVNIDGATGRLLIPAPMGKAGQRYWGLYPSEANTLRAILRDRQRREDHDPWLFYDPGRRAWHINRGVYPTLTAALAYVKDCPITVEEWRYFARLTRYPR